MKKPDSGLRTPNIAVKLKESGRPLFTSSMFVFAGLWILDAYTTMIGMSRGGREEAPLSALEIADFGIGWYVELKVVVCVMAVLGTMVVAWRWRTLRPFYALLSISFALAVLVLTGIAVLNNTIQLNWI